MKEYRSDNFNYFSQEEQEKQKKKTIWKKIWFWIKIVLYVLLFGIAMTGCVQSCVVKSSNYTGNGIEFYTSKNKTSPHVTTFDANNSFTQEDKKYFEKIGVDLPTLEKGDQLFYSENPGANYHLSYKEHSEIINRLKEVHKDSYGAYKNWSSAIQLRDNNLKLLNNQPIVSGSGKNSNNYLFSVQSVEPENNKIVYNQIYDNNEYKEWNFVDPSFDFDNHFVYNLDTKKMELNITKINNGQFDSSIKLGEGDKAQNFTFKKELSYLTINPDNNFLGLGKFRRDIFETLAKNTFYSANAKFYKKVLDKNASMLESAGYSKDYNGLSKWFVDMVKNNKAKEISIDTETYLALKHYNNAIKQYVSNLKFSPSSKISPIKDSIVDQLERLKESYNKLSDKNSTDAEKIRKQVQEVQDQLRMSVKYTSPAPYSVLSFEPSELVSLPFAGDEYQRVISDIGSSWKLGPFYGIFVLPIAWVSAHLSSAMSGIGSWGTILTILIITIILRGAMLALTFRQTINQSKQEELKSKKAKIDAKYADFKNNKQMKARQQQEVSDLYKKHGVNPLDAFVTLIISFPVFIAIWRVIQGLPEIKSTVWLGISFAETSWRRLFFNGEWQYFGILLVVGVVQGLSQFMPQILNRRKFKERTNLEEAKALKKSNKTQRIMSIVFFFITFLFSAGVQVYWIISGLWNIAQTIGIHYFKKSDYYRRKYILKQKA
ncbi:membrane protein insertase YidC [Mycoplasmopsis primatum]|uniref:membrane protein insertase YidC n=1 Tax=Mycoplasmopsis primatum TaxID=55604 RepID=UPI000496EF18|nr:membrane protein insertase YidC [Mycoplasmopsis primatum]